MNDHVRDALAPSSQVRLDEEASYLSRRYSNVSDIVKLESLSEKEPVASVKMDEEPERSEEGQVLRKLDLRILPLLVGTHLLFFLDRGNLGAARLQGILPDVLGNSDQQFALVLAACFIPYIIFNVPATMIGHRMDPPECLAMGVMIWGIAACAQAGTTNFGGLFSCRMIIGTGDAFFAMRALIYLASWYPRTSLAKPMAALALTAPFSGAVGGVIAGSIQEIKSHVATWRILFLIEGLPSIVLAISIFFLLPGRPEDTPFLNEREREIVLRRLRPDGIIEESHAFSWPGARRGFTDPKTYVMAGVLAGINITLASVAGFLPTIIKSMNHTSQTSQWLSIFPYLFSAVCIVLIAWLSDRLQKRGPLLVGVLCIAMIGFIILLVAHENMVIRYFAIFLIVGGSQSAMPLGCSWLSNNCATSSHRSAVMPVANGIGQCFSVIASFLYPSSTAPQYYLGLGLCLGLNLSSMTLTFLLSRYYRRENARRDVLEGGRSGDTSDFETLHDLSPRFRYVE